MHLKLLVFLLLSVYCTNGGRQERIRGLRDLINYPDAQESYFRANRMYTFKYDGQINIGVPDHSDQHSASRMQADVVLVKRSDEHFIIRLRRVQVAKQLSRIEDPQKIQPFEQFEKIELNPRDLTILELPVEFTYSDGQIQDLVFQQREEEWSANLKRGVLSMLQIKLQPKDRNSMEEEQSALNKLDTESKTDVAQVYRTTEKTVEGECDTMYSVNLIRDHTDTSKAPNLIVTKTVDLNSCQKRPKIMTNFQFVQRCPRCEQLPESRDRAIQSSTTMHYQIRGKRDKFLVEFVQMSNDHVIAPQNENENAVVVTIRASLRMVNSQETNQQDTEMSEFPQTGQKVTDIIYCTETEEKQIRFQMQGDNQYPGEMGQQRLGEEDKASAFGEVLMKMIHQMRTSIDDKVNRYLSRAIAMVRTMRENELRAAIQQYSSRHQSGQMSPEEKEKMRNMIPHILAQAGTFNSIKQLSEKIASSEISPFKATMAIPGLMNAAYVSEEMVNELIRLEQSSVAQRNPILKKTIMLTIGSMMKTACAPQIQQQQQQQKYMEARRPLAEEYKCSSETKQRFTRFISECMRRSDKWEDKTLCLRVLGNAGLDSSVQEIEAILRTTDESVPRQSSTIRLEAVMALRHLRNTLPQKTRSILLATATNKLEYSAVRMAAIQQLLQNNPGKLTIDQIISIVNHDPDRRLASFAYQLMKALAESKLGCYHEMNHDLKASIKRVRRMSQQMPVSDIIFESLEDEEKKIGLDIFLLPFYDSDEIVPKYMKAGINTISKGVRAKNLIAFEMGTSGLSSIISDFVQSMPETEKRSAGSTEYGLNLRRFADQMSTNQRSEWRNQRPNAWMSLKFKNQDIFLYTVNEQMLKDMIQFDGIQTIRALTNYMANIRSAVNTDGAKLLQETSIKIPTAIGSSLRLKKKTPIVLSIHGHISSEDDRSQAVNFRAQGKLSAAISMVTDVSSRCPIMNNGIYLIRTAKVMLPIDMSLSVNPKQQEEQIKWTFARTQPNRELLKVESRPVIYFKRSQRSQPEYEEKTIVADKNTRMESFKRCMPMPIFASEVCMRGLISKPTCTNNKLGHFLAPWFGPNKVVFSTYPKESGGRQVTMSMSVQRGSESQGEEEKKIRITVQTDSGKQTMDVEMTKSPDTFVPKQMKAKLRQQSQDQQETEICMMLNSHRHSRDEQMPTGQQEPKKLTIDLKMNWGPQCRPENYWQAKIETAYKQKMYREQHRTLALVDDQDIKDRATYLSAQDETAGYKIAIKHNNMPENVREIYNDIIEFMTHINYWNSQTRRPSINQQQGPNEESIQMVMKNDGRADIKIQTPTKTIVMNNARIPSFLRYEKMKRSNLMRLSKVLVNTNSGATCKVQQDSIHTFDGAMYRIPFGDCYTTLAKNEYPQFTVKAKRSRDQPNKKVVKVTTADHEIKMKPEQEMINVKIDGNVWDERSFTDRSNIQIGRVGRYVSVQLIKQNVRVNFDGESITIWAPEKHHGQRLGMCGNMNADASDEFGHVHSDDRANFWKLFKQMTESDGTCRTPEPQQDFDHRADYEQYDDEKELSHQHIWNRDENEDSNWSFMDSGSSEGRQGERRRYKQTAYRQPDNPEIDDVLTEVSPIRRNKIIEQRGRKCISMTPVERCPEHSYVADRAQEQREIQYTCLDRQDPLFAKTRDMRRQGDSMDLSDRQVSFSRTEMVPRKCVIV